MITGGTIARNTLRQTYMMFAFIVNIVVTMYMIATDDNMMEANMQNAHYFRLIFCGVWLVCAWWYIRDKHIEHTIQDTPTLFRWFIIFTIGICISLMATHIGNIKQFAANILLFIVPCLSLLGSFDIARQHDKKHYIFTFIFITILACIYSYISIFKSYNILGIRGHFGVAYYALYLLPIMLACEKRWLRIISILIVSIVIISSVKRGGLVALVIGLLTYIIIAQLINKNNFKSAILLCSTLVIMSIFFYVMISFLGDNILERLFNSDDETGSGRLNIWESLVQRLFTQDIELWVFGNGHLSTTLYSWENLSAHNDFLEILYNYGIFNLIIYLIFFISLAKYTLTSIRRRSKYAPSLAMMLIVYSILSMISIIILSHTCTLAMITIGLLIGWSEQEKKQLESL